MYVTILVKKLMRKHDFKVERMELLLVNWGKNEKVFVLI